MKSIYLTIFFILIIFVITSEANVKNQINNVEYIPETGKYKVWLKEVSGYDQNDPVNGYAGIIGEPITSLRVSGGQKYIVHILDGEWLDEVDQNDIDYGYAGTVNGKSIDAVAIDGVEYAVHIENRWLPAVNEYNIKDDINGFAGIIGNPIDAIMIKNRTYAVSHTESISKVKNKSNTTNVITDYCIIQGGTCMNPNSCSSVILHQLCPNETNNNKCCILNNNETNEINNSSLFIIFIITATLAIVMIIIVIFLYHYKCSRNRKNKPEPFEELPPYPYPRVIEEEVPPDDLFLNLNYSDKEKTIMI